MLSRFAWLLLTVLAQLLGLAFTFGFGLFLLWQLALLSLTQDLGAGILLGGIGVLSFLALLGVDQLGHLLAGWAVGLRLERVRLGLFVVEREGGQSRTRLNTGLFDPALSVKHKPARGRGGAARWAVMVLGGPLANLLVGAACLAAAAWVSPGPPAGAPAGAVKMMAAFPSLYPADLPTACLNVAGVLSLAVAGHSLAAGRDGGLLILIWQYRRAARAAGYPTAAALLVASALEGAPGQRRSARELSEHLLAAQGEEAEAVLLACGVRLGEDADRAASGPADPGPESAFSGLLAPGGGGGASLTPTAASSPPAPPG